METTCPKCHATVRPTDYFCFNCGASLKPKPLQTTWQKQTLLYLGSIFLPPLGIIWGIRYLKENSQTHKMIGIVCIVLTIVVIILTTILTINTINQVNKDISRQLQTLNNY